MVSSYIFSAPSYTPHHVGTTITGKGPNIILICPGSSMDTETMKDRCKEMARSLNATVYCFDYPGFNGLPGEASEETCIDRGWDVLSVMQEDGYKPEDITLWGISYGCVIAAALANITKEGQFKGLVLESGPKSILDLIHPLGFKTLLDYLLPKRSWSKVWLETIGNGLGSVFTPPVVFGLRYIGCNSADLHHYLKKTSCPIVIIHGECDEVIPITHARETREQFPERVIQYIEMRTGKHYLSTEDIKDEFVNIGTSLRFLFII
jgi:pimeloyl-ACP methyl ester carboxylesterase